MADIEIERVDLSTQGNSKIIEAVETLTIHGNSKIKKTDGTLKSREWSDDINSVNEADEKCKLNIFYLMIKPPI